MLLLILPVLLLSSSFFVNGLNTEGYALLSLKNSITHDPQGSLANWNSSFGDPCSWNGVACMNGKVVSVSMPKKQLSGVLPPELGSLSTLRHVNLRNNEFSGALPAELFRSGGIQSLVLYGNSFSGNLPKEIGNLRLLQTLDLSQNSFNGDLPKEILQCKRLRILDLHRNNFSGALPDGIGDSLASLEKLDFSFNAFSGSIPPDVGNLSNLQGTLDFSHNAFTGLIPPTLGNLPEKVYIDLTYNNLTGPIPQDGALMNRGPTAFIGNPNLCGPPLKTPCPPNAMEAPPSPNRDKKLSRRTIVMIIVGDVFGICVCGAIFSFCYSRICPSLSGKTRNDKKSKECWCFRKDESETVSEHVDHHDLVPLDARVAFDLDELLKASAFVLGKSGIGIVYKVILDDGLTLAVRRLGEGGSQRFKEFQTEVEAIGKIKHPNIVTLRAYYWSVDEKLLIYDYIPNGSLSTALHGKPGTASFTPLSWSVRVVIMKGIARGLLYLHEFSPKKYIHGDLKPSNILLGENMEPLISDFGLARLATIAGGTPMTQSSLHERQQAGDGGGLRYASSYYQAPEAMKVVKPSQKWDVYSYGVMLLEMISGRREVVSVGGCEMDVVQWIHHCIDDKRPLVDVLDPFLGGEGEKEEEIIAVLKIAISCVNSNGEKRPSMRHVLDGLSKLP